MSQFQLTSITVKYFYLKRIPMTPTAQSYKSKTCATWTALIGGSIGLHRFYLYGFYDILGWLFSALTLVGWGGVQRMQQLGVDDHTAWVLIPLLGLSLTASMLTAIVYGLTADDKWSTKFNAKTDEAAEPSGWINVLGVATALFIGTAILMATIAFSAQRYFEYQAEAAKHSVNAPIQTEARKQALK
jgi:hypothetical protein